MIEDEEDRESRFLHLLQPIRDLAQNFGIDVAHELEEYLDVLESITISFEDGPKGVNFVAAAEIIKQSAGIYSRKVEFLHQLIYKTLDALVDHRKQKSRRNRSAEDHDGDVALASLETRFENPEDELKEARDATADIAKLIVGAIPVGYGDSEDDLDNLVINYPMDSEETVFLSEAPTTLLEYASFSTTNDENEFKIARCASHASTGCLLLEERDILLTDLSDRSSVNKDRRADQGDDMLVLHSGQVPPPPPAPEEIPDELPPPPNDFDHIGGDGDDDADDDGPGMDLVDDHLRDEEHLANSRAAQGAERQKLHDVRRRDIEEEEEDPWELLDPHSSNGVPTRPFKKGKTFRIPALRPKSMQSSTQGVYSQTFLNIVRDDPLEGLLARRGHSLASARIDPMKVPQLLEFAPLFWEEFQRKKRLRRSHAKSYQAYRKAAIEFAPFWEEFQRKKRLRRSHAKYGGKFHEDEASLMGGANSEALSQIDDVESLSQDDIDDTDDDGFQFAESFGGDHDHGDNMSVQSNDEFDVDDVADRAFADDFDSLVDHSYEDMCREQVDLYMSKAKQFTRQSTLAKRVHAWEQRLLPKLEDESYHPEFNIDAYGDHLLDALRNNRPVESPEETGKPGGAPKSVEQIQPKTPIFSRHKNRRRTSIADGDDIEEMKGYTPPRGKVGQPPESAQKENLDGKRRGENDGDVDQTVSFGTLLRSDEKQYNVCRYFLAALVLTNKGEITICDKPDGMAIGLRSKAAI